jgi:transposase, IS5 family
VGRTRSIASFAATNISRSAASCRLLEPHLGLIRKWQASDAAVYEGGRLREGLIDTENTASDVWADTACRSARNEDYLDSLAKTSRIHRKKPNGRPMSKATREANAKKSKIRARVEHVFAELKSRMGLVVRTIGMPVPRPRSRSPTWPST